MNIIKILIYNTSHDREDRGGHRMARMIQVGSLIMSLGILYTPSLYASDATQCVDACEAIYRQAENTRSTHIIHLYQECQETVSDHVYKQCLDDMRRTNVQQARENGHTKNQCCKQCRRRTP